MIRSIYARILVWFWLANLGVTATILSITLLSGAQPLGRRWLAASLDLYARAATDIYESGGSPALDTFLGHIQSSVSMQAALIGPNGRSLSTRPIPEGAWVLADAARERGEARVRIGRATWLGACTVHTQEGDYVFLAQVDALGRLSRQIYAKGLLIKAAGALAAGCVLCWLLARSITAPIRTLQGAVRSLGAGDLSVRVSSKIPPRNDELADLAHEFDRMAQEIESLRNEQHRLLGDISHELRSPLTRLSVSTELATRGDTESLGRMRKEITALDELIEQILILTRLEMQQQTRTYATISLEKLLASLVEDAEFEAHEEGKSVLLEARTSCNVTGDPGLLRSCLENVIRNAVRYAPIATSVHVVLEKKVQEKQLFAAVTVQDWGRGVPEKELVHIFEPFYRVPVSEGDGGPASQGSGLGLSISKRIVRLYGGSIAAHNGEDGGLVVVIQFPIAG